MRRMRFGDSLGYLAALAILMLALSCSGGGGGGGNDDDDIVDDDDVANDDDTVWVEKTLEIPGVGRFIWSEPDDDPYDGIAFNVTDVPNPTDWDVESGWLAIGPTLEAQPDGQLFEQPAQLEYFLDANAVSDLGDLLEFGLVRGVSSEGTELLEGEWIARGIHRAEVQHFSSFSLGIPASTLAGEAEEVLRRMADQHRILPQEILIDLFCGDGEVQPPETCDGPSVECGDGCYVGTQTCDAQCRLDDVCDYGGQACGNGTIEGCESCDDGEENGQPNRCGTDCGGMTSAVCGNGVIEPGESCDQGAENGQPNRCWTNCQQITPPYCGNDVIEAGETCDDGADNGRIGFCDWLCGGTAQAVCGDGVAEGDEACDLYGRACTTAENYVGQQACRSDCAGYEDCASLEFCGDGVVNGNEFCDSSQVSCQATGGADGVKRCISDCSDYGPCQSTEFCGDGSVTGAEVCDQGALNGTGLGLCRGDCNSICDYPIEKVSLNDPAYGVALSGDFAYVAAASQGLALVDIHIPGFPGIPDFAASGGVALQVAVNQTNVFVANGNEIAMIDVSSPINPSKLLGFGCCGTTQLTDVVRVIGQRAWMATTANEISIYDISTLNAMPLKTGSIPAETFSDVVASGNVAFTTQNVAVAPSSNRGKLSAYDISDPDNPSLLDEVEFDTGSFYNVAVTLEVAGNYAYVILEKGITLGNPLDGGMAVVNVANPSALGAPAYFNIPLSYGIDISGNTAYIAMGADGITTYDLTNPATPTFAESIQTEGFAYEADIYLGRAFVADGGGGLAIIHLNPSCQATPPFLP